MYEYQQSGRYFAQVADDIKDIAETELLELGAVDTSHSYRGIYFNADPESLYRINLQSRLINKVLAPLKTFNCHSDKYLYQVGQQIHWEDFLTPEQTLAIFANVTQSNINHSKYAALRLKDAIVDYFRESDGKRPSIDRRNPDLWLNVHIEKNVAIISVDTSGGSLHRRGYRTETTEAPMSETLAASIIRYTEWNGQTPLYDPLCGSGTLLCEAYLAVTKTPSANRRNKFGFERLPDFDVALWERVKKEANNAVQPVNNNLIQGSDIDLKVVAIAKKNSAVIDPDAQIKIVQKDIFDIERLENTTIVCNPPYGIRMEKKKDLSTFYKDIGDFLKQRCTNSTAYIYFGDRKYIKQIGLKSSKKWILSNGGLDGRLVKYIMY
ncbi:MAG: class I SAM-dependent RNA methyltransferase [Planctomycetia bacterium]|nr:class I SAM-dependent RNA methyltransferase [Planctomycetia bacterium]